MTFHNINENSDKLLHWSLSDNFNCTKEDLKDIYWNSHADKIMGAGWPMPGAIKHMYDLIQEIPVLDEDEVAYVNRQLDEKDFIVSYRKI